MSEVDALNVNPFSHAGLCQRRVFRTKHLPNQGVLAIDGVRHVLPEVLVEVVHHVHHPLAHVERELLHGLPEVL